MTNYHVIANAGAIRVQLADGRVAQPQVVGVDPDTDLAVLKIDLPNLPVITFGRSDELRVGDVVLAIGDPLGLSQTVTHGIVSATARGQLGITTFEDFIQTDAPINFGNSGGALVDTSGALVGINTAIVAKSLGVEGIGFAIPVDMVRGVLHDIIKYGRVIRGWIGIVPGGHLRHAGAAARAGAWRGRDRQPLRRQPRAAGRAQAGRSAARHRRHAGNLRRGGPRAHCQPASPARRSPCTISGAAASST